MKKCFTINQFRKTEEIESYHVLLKNHIFQAIEIFYPGDLEDKDNITYTENINNLMKYNPEVVMHLPFGPKNDLCNLLEYEKVIKTMKDAISYSKQFNVHKFTLHLGYCHDNRDVVINHIVKVLQELCDYAYPNVIMIENMPGIKEVGYSPKEIKDIINRVAKSNLKFIFDTGHANVSEFSFYEYLELLKTDLKHIHINDNDGSRDQHARIGLGNIDFKSFIKELTDYQELFCLEILYKDVKDLLEYSRDLDNCQ